MEDQPISVADEDDQEVMTERRRRFPILLILVTLTALLLLVIWSGRKPIARKYIDSELARRGVPGRYTITHFGARTQRLENVVIGDPDTPDLTAEWVEVRFGFSGLFPDLTAIRAKGVRLHGRLVDGRLSLGALDRLLPQPSGDAFRLPDLDLALDDARMRLETSAGAIGLAINGRGNLTNGFMGRMAAVSRRLDSGGCIVEQPAAVLHIAVMDRRPAIDGPVRAKRLQCDTAAIENPRAAIDIAFDSSLDGWRGGAAVAAGPIRFGAHGVEALKARLSFEGDPRNNDGRIAAQLENIRAGGLASLLTGFEQTPVGPIMNALSRSVRSATRQLKVETAFHLDIGESEQTFKVAPFTIQSSSGARLELAASGQGGLGWRWPAGNMVADGKLSLSGGGFPEAVLRIRNSDKGLEGKYSMKPYTVPGARLSMEPLSFDDDGFATHIRLDGPLGAGTIRGLDVPLSGQWAKNRLLINASCFPLSFDQLDIAGATVAAAQLPICPRGAALFQRTANGSMTGGASVARPQLQGAIGDAPLLMTARQFDLALAGPNFSIDALSIRLGEGADLTRLDVENLMGVASGPGLQGTLAGAVGKIGAVPLLVSEGAGRWTLADATLGITGRLSIDDAAEDPRFRTLVSRDVSLKLRDGVITGTAALRHPGSNQLITQVGLTHDLDNGIGHASLDVPGIRFGSELQPENLTPLTLGIVALADGTVAGSGRIEWNRDSVRSTGDFATDGMDFAAAFGPVTRLAGKIHFSDLLGMETPPGQTVTIGAINAGVAVENGVVRYQLLPDQVVKIEEGRWPFSGGNLLLEPTLLDFGRPSERHLTFRVTGMDAAQFVEQFEFKNISVTGTFDGVLPMIFDIHGGRIEGGRLVVRESGGTLAYVGEISNEKLGRFGNMAFDALKAIRYRNLAIELNGSLDGEIVSKVIFTGTNEAPVEARKGLMGGLVGLPFKFNITITAPFRSLVNSAQSINNPRGLVQSTLEQQRANDAAKSVQPDESEKVR